MSMAKPLAAVTRARRGLLLITAGAVITEATIVVLQGSHDGIPAMRAFISGSVGSATSLGATLTALGPILLVAAGAFTAFRGGAFDVGQVGQFEFGGLAAGVIAPAAPGPGWVILLVSLASGAAAGALWSLLVSEVSRRVAVELVVLSLIANYLADGLARLVTKTLFQDPAAYSVIATRPVPARAWLPMLTTQTSLNAGIFIALAAAAGLWWLLRRTVFGHRVTMFGANPAAAALSGTDPARFHRRLLALTGSVCGLAGAVQVLGVFHQYQDGSLGGTNSLAWSGITVALVAGSSAAAVLPASALLACLATGFAGIQLELGIDPGLGILLQGLIITLAAFTGRPGLSRRPGARGSNPRAGPRRLVPARPGPGDTSPGGDR